MTVRPGADEFEHRAGDPHGLGERGEWGEEQRGHRACQGGRLEDLADLLQPDVVERFGDPVGHVPDPVSQGVVQGAVVDDGLDGVGRQRRGGIPILDGPVEHRPRVPEFVGGRPRGGHVPVVGLLQFLPTVVLRRRTVRRRHQLDPVVLGAGAGLPVGLGGRTRHPLGVERPHLGVTQHRRVPGKGTLGLVVTGARGLHATGELVRPGQEHRHGLGGQLILTEAP